MQSGVGTWEEAELKAQKSKKKGGSQGGFQTMGLMPPLLTAVLRMGFTVPTPIQRKAIPVLLQNHDVVAMARTGSGKTAAYLVPLFNKLRCEHSTIVGIRAVIISPTRELALQIARVAKKLSAFAAAAVRKADLGLQEKEEAAGNNNMTTLTARSGAAGQKAPYKGPLRCVAVVGGTSLDAQFAEMATNPDIVIATPARLLHIIMEASIKLSQVEAVILDEADRLFEMGLQPQIIQILQRVPEQSVQKSLFSATMPSLLAEFANAGLHNPIPIRLDAEMKLSDKLKQFAFFVRSEEKLAALVFLLKTVVKVRTMTMEEVLALHAPSKRSKKGRRREIEEKRRGGARKRQRGDDENENEEGNNSNDDEWEEDDEDDVNEDGTLVPRNDCGPQAIVFVESRHHIELLERILDAYSISCSVIHGQMDQEARRLGVQRFARKKVSVMVVTDVAARGLDLPLVDHVINFSFPFNPKLFIHRVGRVARAGRAGCAYSLLTHDDMPYYVDLMKFLERPIQCVKPNQTYDNATDVYGFRDDEDGYYGRIPSDDLLVELTYINKLRSEDVEVENQFKVVENAHKKYERTKKKASSEALREVKEKRQKQLRTRLGDNSDDDEDDNNNNNDLKLPSEFVDGSDYYHTPIHPLLLRTRMSREMVLADAAKQQSYIPDDNDNNDEAGEEDYNNNNSSSRVITTTSLTGEKPTRSNTVAPLARSKKNNPQDYKDKDAFGNLRRKGVVGTSHRKQKMMLAQQKQQQQGGNNNNKKY